MTTTTAEDGGEYDDIRPSPLARSVTIHGTIAGPITSGATRQGVAWAAFPVDATERAWNPARGGLENIVTRYDRVVAFGAHAVAAREGLREGSVILLAGDLTVYEQTTAPGGQGLQVVAQHLGASLEGQKVTVSRRPGLGDISRCLDPSVGPTQPLGTDTAPAR